MRAAAPVAQLRQRARRAKRHGRAVDPGNGANCASAARRSTASILQTMPMSAFVMIGGAAGGQHSAGQTRTRPLVTSDSRGENLPPGPLSSRRHADRGSHEQAPALRTSGRVRLGDPRRRFKAARRKRVALPRIAGDPRLNQRTLLGRPWARRVRNAAYRPLHDLRRRQRWRRAFLLEVTGFRSCASAVAQTPA
jgi:hypothetical protein